MLPRFIRVAFVTAVVALALQPPIASAHSDQLPFAVRFPQEMEKTEFSASFGAPRPGERVHQGVDLMAPKMTEVYAFADGVVSLITTSRLAGRYLVIGHDEEWETYYVHLNDDTPGTNDRSAAWTYTVASGIEEGTEVTAGQLIGWVGDSGNAKGGSPHTHFELHRNGRPIDPYPYLMYAWEQGLLAPILLALESMPYEID